MNFLKLSRYWDNIQSTFYAKLLLLQIEGGGVIFEICTNRLKFRQY